MVDSQSVKGAVTVSSATRGYDANKHINGGKRDLLVDQDGLLVDLLVTPADAQDRDAARIQLTRFHTEHRYEIRVDLHQRLLELACSILVCLSHGVE
ncbi:transposase [Streptomyces sp. NBC_00243]|uniref:transposase n=1 Tax=Streptomyces sp. NBC_00243 TaxID=2975688 RepID=UPI003FA3CB4C